MPLPVLDSGRSVIRSCTVPVPDVLDETLGRSVRYGQAKLSFAVPFRIREDVRPPTPFTKSSCPPGAGIDGVWQGWYF